MEEGDEEVKLPPIIKTSNRKEIQKRVDEEYITQQAI